MQANTACVAARHAPCGATNKIGHCSPVVAAILDCGVDLADEDGLAGVIGGQNEVGCDIGLTTAVRSQQDY
jgi:hypothetical protein